ncbi:MAG: nitroreductase family protein [Armatimonadota bacterium]|nr:nitroreductase family protein [Armatimonadota bacterium]MDR7470358.1 nitroreductase family protein [Armatimonadota bacterium]MDR7475222.1 nitroreductase family protein [Armatimonadota bacterium]MDR7539564.1 nitroreductase family protein [Armatimonadota bacterium]
MEAYRCIRSKREVRSFLAAKVPRETIVQILEAGRWSGSSRNRQPWHFVVVTERQGLKQLARCGRFAAHLADAAFAVAVAVEAERDSFDAGRCAQNMMLAAWALGVGSCPTVMHDEARAKELLGLPPSMKLAVVVAFGLPAKKRSPVERIVYRVLLHRGRKPLEQIVSWERYGAA